MTKPPKTCAGCDELRRQLGFAWDLVGKLSVREPFVVPSPPLPDTASIVKEAIGGVATIVNGWKETAIAQMTSQPPAQLSMDGLGFDNNAGIPPTDDFIPPWETADGMDMPVRSGWVNPPTNGAYKPYIPGEGNTVPPTGGVE